MREQAIGEVRAALAGSGAAGPGASAGSTAVAEGRRVWRGPGRVRRLGVADGVGGVSGAGGAGGFGGFRRAGGFGGVGRAGGFGGAGVGTTVPHGGLKLGLTAPLSACGRHTTTT